MTILNIYIYIIFFSPDQDGLVTILTSRWNCPIFTARKNKRSPNPTPKKKKKNGGLRYTKYIFFFNKKDLILFYLKDL